MKVYTKTYNRFFEQIAKASPQLEVPADSKVSFAVPFPSEGFLERVVIWQTNAPDDGIQGPQDFNGYNFEVEILNSKIPFPPGTYGTDDDPEDELTAYRIQTPITAPLSANAGDVLSLVDDDFGIGFRNIDGGWTLNQRYIYLVIKPVDASEDTYWNAVLQCRTDVG